MSHDPSFEHEARELMKTLNGFISKDYAGNYSLSMATLPIIQKALQNSAALPKPRPLRELIAAGHEQFWVWVAPDNADTTGGSKQDAWLMRDKKWADFIVHIGREGLLDCHAIPIMKPTVTL